MLAEAVELVVLRHGFGQVIEVIFDALEEFILATQDIVFEVMDHATVAEVGFNLHQQFLALCGLLLVVGPAVGDWGNGAVDP